MSRFDCPAGIDVGVMSSKHDMGLGSEGRAVYVLCLSSQLFENLVGITDSSDGGSHFAFDEFVLQRIEARTLDGIERARDVTLQEFDVATIGNGRHVSEQLIDVIVGDTVW